jgi:hypothetical protein
MNEHHKTVTADPEYDVTFHPGFASECTITRKGEGPPKQLYKQTEKHDCRPEGGHPKKHVIRLKGKNGSKRDITITIDDPEHSVHSLSLELYDESRDVTDAAKFDPGTTETFTVTNTADTCPPHCDPI